jgi:uncharacterized protein (TIGR02147 family)
MNIYDYIDYRDFLTDYYLKSKEANKNFSYRFFAKKAGLRSPNLYQMIIKKKRHLGKYISHQFSQAMGLSKREQNYFEALISFNKAKTPEARKYYLELMSGLRRDRVGAILNDNQYEYLSNWYYPVIREMIMLTDFKEDYLWIKNKLNNKVTLKQIKAALETLLNLGLIARNETGRLEQRDIAIATTDDVRHVAAYKFHRQMLRLADDILITSDGENREISALTTSLSKKQFDNIKIRIREFEQEIMQYVTENPKLGEAVYQMNIHLFPLTKGEK